MGTIKREVWRRRPGYGTAKWLLIGFLVFAAYDVSRVVGLLHEHQAGQSGLARVALGNYGQQKLLEMLLRYAAIAGLLGLAVIASRGEKLIIEERADDA